jgi:hypothetical protein
VTAQHIGSAEDLHNCLVLFSSRAQNSLDFELWRSGDVDAIQQFPKSASGEWSFISKSLDLIGDMVLFLLLEITQRSVVLVMFIFVLVAFFFFLILLLMVVVVVVILWVLLSFLCVFSRRYRDHNLKVVLLLRNVLRDGLRLQLRWHMPRRQLTNEQTSSALAGCAARMSHLNLEI